jgi:hypothetical protein
MISLFKENKGQFSYAFVFAIMLMVLIFVFFFVAPLLQAFLAGMYAGMSPIVELAKDSASGIDNLETRTAFEATITAQETAVVSSNQVLGAMIGFGGVFIVILTAFVFYLLSRRNVQAGQLG